MWAGQKIHASVTFCPSTYRPRAVLPPGSILSNWDERIHQGNDECIKWLTKQNQIFEMDMFDLSGAEIIVNRLSSKQGNDYELWLQRLVVMTGFSEFSALLNLLRVMLIGERLSRGPLFSFKRRCCNHAGQSTHRWTRTCSDQSNARTRCTLSGRK
jgi:hypothetical protein